MSNAILPSAAVDRRASPVMPLFFRGVAGPVAFLGLIVPHIVRRSLGYTNHFVVLPLCFLGGAALLLYADIIARHLNAHVETPAGVVAAPVGALIFIYLARREKLAG